MHLLRIRTVTRSSLSRKINKQDGERLMSHKFTIAILVTSGVLFGGCSKWDSGKTFEFPDFDLTVKTDPETLQVGKNAEFSILISDQEQVVIPGCVTRFRQFMPGMEMSSDNDYFDMREVKKGVYKGKSSEFSMGGDWVIEFDIKCQNSNQLAQVPYHLEWPE